MARKGKEMENRLQELRWQKNFSQAQLERISGVSKSIINKLEQDRTASTSIETAYKLAKALGVTIEDIFPNQYKNGEANGIKRIKKRDYRTIS